MPVGSKLAVSAQLDDSRRSPRRLSSDFASTNSETRSTGPIWVEAPGQAQHLDLPQCPSKVGLPAEPFRGRWPGPLGNCAVPCPDLPGVRKNLLLPTRYPVL